MPSKPPVKSTRPSRPSLDPEALETLVVEVGGRVDGTRRLLEQHITDTIEERKATSRKLDAIKGLLVEVLDRLPEAEPVREKLHTLDNGETYPGGHDRGHGSSVPPDE